MKSLTVFSALALFSAFVTAQKFSSTQCGATAGNQRCPGTLCCSQYGWCGSTEPYCSSSTCQSSFGTCKGVATAPVSTNGRCGSNFGGQTCKGSRFGSCCSVYEWCGSSSSHCATSNGCQSGFGTCSGSASSSLRSSSTSSAQRSSSSLRPLSGSSTRTSSSATALPSSSTSAQVFRASSRSSSMVTQRSSSVSSGTPTLSRSSQVSSTLSAGNSGLSSPFASSSASSSVSRDSSASNSGRSATPAASQSSVSLAGGSSASVTTQADRISSSVLSSSQSSPALSSPTSTSTRSSTLVNSLPSLATPSSNAQAFNRDPMENPSNFARDKTSDLIGDTQINDPAGAHSGSSYIRIESSDANGASLTLSAQATVVSGTRYLVTLWVKSTVAGGACTVAIRIGSQTIAQSGSNLPTTWTSISGYYTAQPGPTSPALAIDVSCPAVRAGRIRRRQTGAGVDLDDLTMVTDSSVSSSSSSVASTTSFVYGDDVTVLPLQSVSSSLSSLTSTASFAYGNDVTVLPPKSSSSSIPAVGDDITVFPPSTSTEVRSIPAIPSSTPTSKSSPASISTSPSLSNVPPSTASAASVTSSADACTPTLIDTGFESMSSTSSSSDWSTINDFGSNTGSHFFGNVVLGSGQSSQNAYGAYTNDPGAVQYNIEYLHPIKLCRGTTYHISAFVRTDQQDTAWTEGCRISAFLNDEMAWSDRIGYYDWKFRYLDGTVTPIDDTSTAKLYFQVKCEVPQIQDRRRGIQIDNVSILPDMQWSLPAAAAPATTTTSTRPAATPTKLPQYQAECVPVSVVSNANGCAITGNQIPDPSFELCSDKTWIYNAGQTSSQWDFGMTGVFLSDDSHSGNNRLQLMFNQEFGGVFQFAPPNIPACAERTYIYSFWAKQATANLCTAQVYWGNKLFGTHVPPAPQTGAGWAQFNGTIEVTGKGDMFYGNELNFQIQCNEGGPKSLSWYDDFRFQRI